MPRAARILTADDVPSVRLGLAALLNRQAGVKVCGEAHDRASLLKSVAALKPDAVIVDVFEGDFSGLDLVRDILERHAESKVLVYTGYDEVLFAERAVRIGAAGFVMKREPLATLVKSVRHILKGGIFVTPRATGRLLHQMAGHPAPGAAPSQPLSDREIEVLRRMGEGFSSREMAEAMHVSIKTVEAHREHIKSKLGLKSGSGLLRLAIQWAHVARG